MQSPFVVTAGGRYRRGPFNRSTGQRGSGTFTPTQSSFTADGGSVTFTYSDARRWIEDRGITPFRGDRDDLAFAIQASILEEGVRPTNWIEDALDNDFVEEALGEAHARATERVLDDAFNLR